MTGTKPRCKLPAGRNALAVSRAVCSALRIAGEPTARSLEYARRVLETDGSYDAVKRLASEYVEFAAWTSEGR